MNNSAKSSSFSQKTQWFMACILILAIGVGSFMLLKALKPEPQQRQQSQYTPIVETIPLQYRQQALLVQGNGIVSPKAEIGLSSQVSGEIISIHPNLGSGGFFSKGEVIVQIDPRTYAANLAEAEANKRASESSLLFIEKQIERLRSLLTQGYSPEESLDDAISRRDQTIANIDRQEALIDIRIIDLERTEIKAPFNGKLLSENVGIGDYISMGQEIARFYSSDEIELVVALSPEDAAFIPGLWTQDNDIENQRKAWINVNYANQTYQWDGYLDRVEADIDQLTRTVDVVIRASSPLLPGNLVGNTSSSITIEAPPLLIGMYSQVSIEGLDIPQHFVVPIHVLRDNNTIWIANNEGQISIEEVEFIRAEGNQVVLLAPQLPLNSKIIISNIATVSNGMNILVNETNVTQGAQ